LRCPIFLLYLPKLKINDMKELTSEQLEAVMNVYDNTMHAEELKKNLKEKGLIKEEPKEIIFKGITYIEKQMI